MIAPFYNWYLCEGQFNDCSQLNVPEGWLFLDYVQTDDCRLVFRRCDVPAGDYKVFFPLVSQAYYDFDDDTNCDIVPREDLIESLNILEPRTTIRRLQFKKNGFFLRQSTYFLRDNEEAYFENCQPVPGVNQRDQRVCDDACDSPRCERYGGVDAYPSAGWFGYDEASFVAGQTYTYETQAKFVPGPFTMCQKTRYVLKAV